MQIENFFARNSTPARVSGGRVKADKMSFNLQTQLNSGMDKIRDLSRDLGLLFGLSDVQLVKRDGRFRLDVRRRNENDVELLDLLNSLESIPSLTTTLGIDEADRPVLLNLLSQDVHNILVAGDKDAGKSTLLRTMALSLLMTNKQSQVQFGIIALDGENGSKKNPKDYSSASLIPIGLAPHSLFPVVQTLQGAYEALAFFDEEIAYRKDQSVTTPLVIAVIDGLDGLIENGSRKIRERLFRLLHDGPEVGFRSLISVNNPTEKSVRPFLRNNIPIRLIGRMANANFSRAAAGVPDTYAEFLHGRGDFMAVVQGSLIPFQSAIIDNYDLHLMLQKLHRQNRPALLAKPQSSIKVNDDEPEKPEDELSFKIDPANGSATLDALDEEATLPGIDNQADVIDSQPSLEDFEVIVHEVTVPKNGNKREMAESENPPELEYDDWQEDSW